MTIKPQKEPGRHQVPMSETSHDAVFYVCQSVLQFEIQFIFFICNTAHFPAAPIGRVGMLSLYFAHVASR